jgi:RNA polymerase sigma-70 factor, ECF subfamily
MGDGDKGARELDRRTLEACRRGDRAAFRALVACYQDRVYALCVALAGADGEDLAQETFVRVHGAVARFDPDGSASLGGWILTIARRLCVDRARAQSRQTALALDLARAAATAADTSAAGGAGGDVDGDLDRVRRGRALRRAIADLPVEQRAVVALQLWDGLDYEEIAAVEAVPVGTVRSRLARAKEALRRALDEAAGATGDEGALRKGNGDGN